MQYDRKIYLDRLVRRMHDGTVKAVTGLRRCGKSYLIFKLFKGYLLDNGVPQGHIHEMAFDDFANERFRDPEVFYPYIKSLLRGKGMHYLLLDEIQLLGKFEFVLNGLARLDNVDIYVTGSNAKFLSRDVITEFRGRATEVHLTPLLFAEYCEVGGQTRTAALDSYCRYGGLPKVALAANAEDKEAYLKSILSETYLQDIVGRNRFRHREELEEIMSILSSAIGSLTNTQKLAQTFSSVKKQTISRQTIKRYIDALSDSFLIEGAHRYDVKGRKYIGTPLKYYYADLGLRNAWLDFRQIERSHAMENVLYNEIRARGFNVDVGVVVVNGKNGRGISERRQLEIDFVCNKGDKRIYVQSALAIPDNEKLEQEQASLRRVDDSFRKMIVTAENLLPWKSDAGVEIVGVLDFLCRPELWA